MALLRDRYRNSAGAAAELENRSTRPTGKTTEPFDVGSAFERRVVEVVQGREARGLGRVTLGALPVTRRGRYAPPSRV